MADKTNKRTALITDMEKQLYDMETTLDEYYLEAGKSIIEMAESEGKKVNALVDDIITTKKKLMELRGETIIPACEADSADGEDTFRRYDKTL